MTRRLPSLERLLSRSLVALLAILLVAGALWAHQPTLVAEEGIVVAAHPIAAEVGAEVLREGGNAVDAAVAIGMALAVVYPRAGNLGGGGFMIYRSAEGEVHALDFREEAPSAADRDMYLDEDGEVVEGASTRGHLAAGVPGSVAGLARAREEWGSRPWAELLRPAWELARKGFPVDPVLAAETRAYREDLAAFPATAAIFLPDGEPLEEGEILRQPDLARTLRRLIRKGPREFYEGETARLLVAEMQRGGGRISRGDLARYEAVLRRPVTFAYRDLVVHSMPPPSSGGLALAQILGVLEGFDLAAAGPLSARAIHLTVEAERQAYADRSKWLGDTDHVDVPAGALTSPAYLRSLRRDLRRAEGRARSSSEVRPLVLVGREPGDASEDTTHYSIVDPGGASVSVTTTINSAYGSKVVVEGAGFFLNNEMDDFSIKPGHPNLYGLVGGELNAVEPGKRPLSSMSPTIVERGGELWAVLGTPGGSTIITSVAQVLMNVRDYGMDMERAVAWPRFHHQWLPDRVDVEPYALSPDTRRILEENGYRFHEREAIGDVQAIQVLPDGRLSGVADPRGIGEAHGF